MRSSQDGGWDLAEWLRLHDNSRPVWTAFMWTARAVTVTPQMVHIRFSFRCTAFSHGNDRQVPNQTKPDPADGAHALQLQVHSLQPREWPSSTKPNQTRPRRWYTCASASGAQPSATGMTVKYQTKPNQTVITFYPEMEFLDINLLHAIQSFYWHILKENHALFSLVLKIRTYKKSAEQENTIPYSWIASCRKEK